MARMEPMTAVQLQQVVLLQGKTCLNIRVSGSLVLSWELLSGCCEPVRRSGEEKLSSRVIPHFPLVVGIFLTIKHASDEALEAFVITCS